MGTSLEQNGDQPATKRDLAQLEERLEDRLTQAKAELREAMHDMETRLLTAFYGWARATDQRLGELNIFDKRLSLMEGRITEVERRLNMPTPPPGTP